MILGSSGLAYRQFLCLLAALVSPHNTAPPDILYQRPLFTTLPNYSVVSCGSSGMPSDRTRPALQEKVEATQL